jgi:hypothetical protein
MRVGSYVDVIQNQSKGDPKTDKFVLHNALIRLVRRRPAVLQEIQKVEGKSDLTPQFDVILEISDGEVKVLKSVIEASNREHKLPIFELRASGAAKKADEKNSTKVP